MSILYNASPSTGVHAVKLLECISAINQNNRARQFTSEFLSHFGVARSSEPSHNFLTETANFEYPYMSSNSVAMEGVDSAELNEAPVIPILRRSPRKQGRMSQSLDCDSPTFTTLKTPKKRQALNPSPRKRSSVSPYRTQVVQNINPDPMDTMHSTPTHQIDDQRKDLDISLSGYNSPVLNDLSQGESLENSQKEQQRRKMDTSTSARNDKCVTRMRPLVKNRPSILVDEVKNRPSILVDEVKLNRCSKVAKSHKNPGYAMTMKIMPLLFSDIEMAMSRGQGLAPPAKGDFRPPLDQERVATLREYIPAWCSISNTEPPNDKDLNKAITEAISYARKKVNKKGSSDNK